MRIGTFFNSSAGERRTERDVRGDECALAVVVAVVVGLAVKARNRSTRLELGRDGLKVEAKNAKEVDDKREIGAVVRGREAEGAKLRGFRHWVIRGAIDG